MPKKKSLLDYALKGYEDAPMASDYSRIDEEAKRINEANREENKRIVRQNQMKESVKNIQDELEYGKQADRRAAQRRALEREYKKRGF